MAATKKEPYIFISYAHKDKKRVLPVIDELKARGYSVWYDAGIEVGSEWPRILAEKLLGCAIMIAFVSEGYVESDNCQRELTYAQNKNKTILTVFDGIGRERLPLGIDMQLGLEQSINRDDYLTVEEFVNALIESSIFKDANLVEEVKPVEEHTKKRNQLSLFVAMLEFATLIFSIRGFREMGTSFADIFMRSFAFIFLPHVIALIIMLIAMRSSGKKLNDEERYWVGAVALLCMVMTAIVSFIAGIFLLPDSMMGILRAFVSLVVNVVVYFLLLPILAIAVFRKNDL